MMCRMEIRQKKHVQRRPLSPYKSKYPFLVPAFSAIWAMLHIGIALDLVSSAYNPFPDF